MGERWLWSVGDEEGSRARRMDDRGPRMDEGGLPPGLGGPRECSCDGCVADIMAGLGRGRHAYEEPYPGPGGGGGRDGDDRGMITELVLVDGHLVDVRTGPVGGSGYECAFDELQARGALRPPKVVERPYPVREVPYEAMLDWLERVVGGPETLADLDPDPLPAGEEFDLTALPGWVRERAVLVDEHVQAAYGHQLLGPELLTACRRLVVRAAGVRAFDLWRGVEEERLAATILHCVIKANALTGGSGPFAVTTLLGGLAVGVPTDRSRRLARLVGGSSWAHGRTPREAPDVYLLGDAGLLLSSFRSDLIAYRDLAERVREEETSR